LTLIVEQAGETALKADALLTHDPNLNSHTQTINSNILHQKIIFISFSPFLPNLSNVTLMEQCKLDTYAGKQLS
jgi:hypothetical protein